MNLYTLSKLQFKVSFGLSSLKWYAKKDKKKILGGLAIIIVAAASLAPIYFFLYINLLRLLYTSGRSLGQPEVMLSMAIVMASLIVLIFSIAFLMSAFYFSRDLPVLIPLPLKPREIIGSKFIVILFQEYLTVIPLILPAIIIYGVGEGSGLYYWLSAILITLLIPIIPLAIMSAATLLIMRVTNLGRRKDFLRLAGMSLIIIVALTFNYFMTRLAPMGEEKDRNLLSL